MSSQIEVLTPADLPEAVEVLTAAFADDLLMKYLFHGDRAGIAELTGFSCAYRFAVGWPVLGLRLSDGALGGVAGFSLPGLRPDPAAFDAVEEVFRTSIDPAAWERYKAYAAASPIGAPAGPCHYLGIIGVLPELKGTGCGRTLIEAVHDAAAVDPMSAGVWLDTEVPANVAWYERRGYRLQAVNRLGDIAVSVMFRPRPVISA
jgi:GNAT superfamily N-acetyltransferase